MLLHLTNLHIINSTSLLDILFQTWLTASFHFINNTQHANIYMIICILDNYLEERIQCSVITNLLNLFLYTWCILNNTVYGFFKVRFHSLSKVVRVATKVMRPCCHISRFRLAHSEDCTIFLNLLDGSGNNAVFKMFVTISFKQH